MVKPHDIPQDVWNGADEVWTDLANYAGGKTRDGETELIARAILAERRRAVAACTNYRKAMSHLEPCAAKMAGDPASLIIENDIRAGAVHV